jgi:hypothetical protein
MDPKKPRRRGPGRPLDSERAKAAAQARWGSRDVSVVSPGGDLTPAGAPGVTLEDDFLPMGKAATTRAALLRSLSAPRRTVLDLIAEEFPEFLEESWWGWRVYLKALEGLPLEPDELEFFQAKTGRSRSPSKPVRASFVSTGRRGGKSLISALKVVYRATMVRTWKLAPGEWATIPIIAADRLQATTILNYVRGLLMSSPRLKKLIVGKPTRDTITLSNRTKIRIFTASFRTSRGYTLAAAFGDEVAFWRNEETSTNPDREILAALKPGLLTSGGPLIVTSTPYARAGQLWENFKAHWARDDDPVLFWKASSLDMNPSLPGDEIADAYKADPEAAAAEFGGEFRSDLASFISEEVLMRAVVPGVTERGYIEGTRFVAFVDPSGGSQDSFTLGIAHLDRARELVVLDRVFEAQAPFSPEAVVATFAQQLQSYRIKEVTGDFYAGDWPGEQFRKRGIQYKVAEETKSELYLRALPMLTSNRVELLDAPRLLSQLRNLERRTGRTGRDSVDHPPRQHDDVANAACGALTLVQFAGKSFDSMTWSHTKNTHLGSRGGQYRDPRVSDQPTTYRRSDRGDERIEDDPAAHDIASEAHRFECGICRAKWEAQ